MSTPHARPVRRALAAVAAAGALILVPTAAQAQSWSHKDAQGDVQLLADDGAVTVPAPDRVKGDVVRVKVVHGTSRVSIRFTQRAAAPNHLYFYALRTAKADYELTRSRVGRDSDIRLTKAGKSKKLPCDGIAWSLAKGSTIVTASIPRSCVGNPRWIRAGVGVLTLGPAGMYTDDGLQPDSFGDLTLSPRVRKG
ncbi:MAG TPA: hypothetical protein VNS81_04365 [Nocardioides sp.]|nr:hypothetical protein [Nocardioides sp.]